MREYGAVQESADRRDPIEPEIAGTRLDHRVGAGRAAVTGGIVFAVGVALFLLAERVEMSFLFQAVVSWLGILAVFGGLSFGMAAIIRYGYRSRRSGRSGH
jgi:protein-S-isoprenylcysteine O-methyltransferase Ste14